MQSRISFIGNPGETYSVASTDVAQLLDTGIMSLNSRSIIGILLTCETGNIRFALGGAIPTQAGLGHILYATQSLVLMSSKAARTFRFISAAAGTPGTLQITPYYE